MGKGDRKKKPRKKFTPRKPQEAAPIAPVEPQDAAERPTEQRLARGMWALPKGMGKHERPAVSLTSDAVGTMYEHGYITTHQEQAARTVQEVHARYSVELGLSQGRSCLDISPVGHDDSEGDPEAIAEWRRITGKLSYWQEGALLWTVINNHPPGNLELLRAALDAVAGIRRMAAE